MLAGKVTSLTLEPHSALILVQRTAEEVADSIANYIDSRQARYNKVESLPVDHGFGISQYDIQAQQGRVLEPYRARDPHGIFRQDGNMFKGPISLASVTFSLCGPREPIEVIDIADDALVREAIEQTLRMGVHRHDVVWSG